MNVGGNTYSIAMGCFGAKAILSSSGVSFANDHLNGTCHKIRLGNIATCD